MKFDVNPRKLLIELSEEEITLRLANIMLGTEQKKVIVPLLDEEELMEKIEEVPEPVENKWAQTIESFFESEEARNKYDNWLKENYGEEKDWSQTKWGASN